MKLFLNFFRDDTGVTAIQYAMLCALIFLVIVSGIIVLSTQTGELSKSFYTIGNQLSS
jgi:Flp pilus assembly pilin Flp